METDFLSYELALALNELGYNKPTILFDNQLLYRNGKFCQANQDAIDVFKNWNDELVIALTFSQAFKFFRDKYELYGFAYQYINHDNIYDSEPFFYNGKFVYGIERIAKNNTTISENDVLGFDFKSEHYDSNEKAELACLNKLIEICKKKTILV